MEGLATFVPGKISSKYAEIFEGSGSTDGSYSDNTNRPPRRKLLNFEKIFKKVEVLEKKDL